MRRGPAPRKGCAADCAAVTGVPWSGGASAAAARPSGRTRNTRTSSSVTSKGRPAGTERRAARGQWGMSETSTAGGSEGSGMANPGCGSRRRPDHIVMVISTCNAPSDRHNNPRSAVEQPGARVRPCQGPHGGTMTPLRTHKGLIRALEHHGNVEEPAHAQFGASAR